MRHFLLAIKNLVTIGDLCIFGIQCAVEITFIFSRIDTDKCYLILLIIESINILLRTQFVDLQLRCEHIQNL